MSTSQVAQPATGPTPDSGRDESEEVDFGDSAPRLRGKKHLPRVRAVIATRQDGLPQAVTDIAWAAQLCLHAKFKRLLWRRMMKTKAVVAVARELVGFVWAVAREVQTSDSQGSRPALMPSIAALLAPLLSMVIFSGTPLATRSLRRISEYSGPT